MKKWLPLLSLLLLVFAGLAFADASNPTISSVAVDGKTDLSIAYLSSLFGTVSGVLNGTSGQMLGKILYQFNQGLLVVAGLWLGFTTLTIVFKSAISGSFMSQDNKVAMIFLRIALGFGLLIPNPSTGYTLLQGIVMQVVVQGVKLADQVWEYGLTYINNGGAIWSRPAQAKEGGNSRVVSTSDTAAILGTNSTSPMPAVTDGAFSSSLGLIQKIIAMETCMVKSSINSDQDAANSSNDDMASLTNSASGSTIYAVNENGSNFRFEFPGNSSSNDACGYVDWSAYGQSSTSLGCVATADGQDINDDAEPQCQFNRLALREIINDLLPAVKKKVCEGGIPRRFAAAWMMAARTPICKTQ